MYLHLSLVLKLHNLFLLFQGSSPFADLERNTKNYLKSWYDDSSKQKIQCKVKKGWEKEREERETERERGTRVNGRSTFKNGRIGGWMKLEIKEKRRVNGRNYCHNTKAITTVIWTQEVFWPSLTYYHKGCIEL